jgi:hypothetical protein
LWTTTTREEEEELAVAGMRTKSSMMTLVTKTRFYERELLDGAVDDADVTWPSPSLICRSVVESPKSRTFVRSLFDEQ